MTLEWRGPAAINYSITAMALVIAARAHSFDHTMRFNSLHYSSHELHKIEARCQIALLFFNIKSFYLDCTRVTRRLMYLPVIFMMAF